jgi:hypothetical protein
LSFFPVFAGECRNPAPPLRRRSDGIVTVAGRVDSYTEHRTAARLAELKQKIVRD